MDFATMGKVGSYIRQKNLSFAANYKIRTGQRVMDSSGNLNFTESMFASVNETTKKTADEIKSARLATIKSKLMAGRKLTDEEMGYLRENDDDLYKKAKHAEDAREELKAELKGAKTKQEAREILTRAMVKASAEATAELAAFKSGVAIGSGAAGGAVTGDVSTGNISASEISTTENISGVESVSNVNENSTNGNVPNADENSNEGGDTAQGILEKFIMTIRALEDEWAKFVNSDEYKDLPDIVPDKESSLRVSVPNMKFTEAIFTYRQASLEKNYAEV